MSGPDEILALPARALESLPGLRVTVEDSGAKTHPSEHGRSVRIEGPHGVRRYRAVPIGGISPETLDSVLLEVARLARTEGEPPLLITPDTTRALQDELVARGIEFVDGAGNCFLRGDGLYVLAIGRRRATAARATTPSSLTPTRLQVVFALLRDPELVAADFRTVAEAAGVSLGTVSHTHQQLRDQGHIVPAGQGAWRLGDVDALRGLWDLGYTGRLRAKLLPTPLELGPGRDLTSLRDQLTAGAGAATGTLIGGELGAAILTGALRPATATLHTTATPRELMVALRLRPAADRAGKVIVLRRFTPLDDASAEGHPNLAHRLLLRAELLALGGDRLREVVATLSTPPLPGDP